LREFSGYILDLDGTVYVGDRLIPGADRAVARLRERGAGVVFLSNNSHRAPQEYAARLTELGIPCAPDQVITSGLVLGRELLRSAPDARLYVIGEESFRRYLFGLGFRPALRPDETDVVVLASDRTLHYGKLLFAHRAVSRGARMWATNPDPTMPLEGGEVPGCGTVVAALERSTGRRVDRICGKPSPAVLEEAARRLGQPLTECLVVGDRLDTDILMARQAGCPSALVLTGVVRREMLAGSEVQPDYVLESVADLSREGLDGPRLAGTDEAPV